MCDVKYMYDLIGYQMWHVWLSSISSLTGRFVNFGGQRKFSVTAV